MQSFIKQLRLIGTFLLILIGLTGCAAQDDGKIVIYSNADDEAITAIKNALDKNGYSDEYLLQSFATSELGGRIMAEGKKIEADLVTMSTYYIDTAQNENASFLNLNFDHTPLKNDAPAYSAPITAQEGTIIFNSQAVNSEHLPLPQSLKDLSKPEYFGKIAIPDITGSSTGWLLVQAIIDTYGETEGAEIMGKLLSNAGPHIESSGSGPFKKVKAGEVAFAFGLRHQAVSAKNEHLFIDFIDPSEGSYSLTESLAIINKDEKTNPKAIAMAKCILKNARPELLKTYPLPLYENESTDKTLCTLNPKTFSTPLTIDLLQKHQDFSEDCKLKNNF